LEKLVTLRFLPAELADATLRDGLSVVVDERHVRAVDLADRLVGDQSTLRE
jgi:hypothetical protein